MAMKERKFECCLCGKEVIRKEKIGVKYAYPKEMLCLKHKNLVNSIMNKFDWWRGWDPKNEFSNHDRYINRSWVVEDNWKDFVDTNRWILNYKPRIGVLNKLSWQNRFFNWIMGVKPIRRKGCYNCGTFGDEIIKYNWQVPEIEYLSSKTVIDCRGLKWTRGTLKVDHEEKNK